MGEGTVLLRRSSLGDVVLLGAVTSRVPGPVTVVTDARYAEVVARLRGVDRVVPWPSRASELPPGRLVDLHATLRSRWLLKGRRAARVDKHSVRRRLRLRMRWLAPRPTVPELYARACGVRPARPPWIDVGRSPDGTLVLVPGARWATKSWEAARFAAVGASWSGPVVVLGSASERSLCETVAESVGSRSVVVAEDGFDGAFAVLRRASAMVAGDTGLLHLAGAAGLPVVGLFGPTHPDDGFFVYPGRIAARDLPCRPCSLRGDDRCPLEHHRCMADLDVAEVRAALAAAHG